MAAPASVAADRAAYNLASGGKAIQGTGDLVADYGEGTIDPAKVSPELLPREMQRMSAAERTRYVARQKETRDGLNQTLAALSKKRADYLDAEQKRLTASPGKGDTFDTKVAEIISAEAQRPR